mmetsp:Transcript_29243/g.71319  ORF Transcript_29243/g.71319 Transcript_29243/m.71319 type:complete len:111 (-) Transcript_29243:399-731(-)
MATDIGRRAKKAIPVTTPNKLGAEILGSGFVSSFPSWRTFFEKIALSANAAFEPMAVKNESHEKDRLLKHARATPPTTGTRLRYTGRAKVCFNITEDSTAEKKGSSALMM